MSPDMGIPLPTQGFMNLSGDVFEGFNNRNKGSSSKGSSTKGSSSSTKGSSSSTKGSSSSTKGSSSSTKGSSSSTKGSNSSNKSSSGSSSNKGSSNSGSGNNKGNSNKGTSNNSGGNSNSGGSNSGNNNSNNNKNDKDAQKPMSREEWNKYFEDTYGKNNVTWDSQNISSRIEPSLPKGSKPGPLDKDGNPVYEKPDSKDPRPINRQNEAADLLASNGYDITMLPEENKVDKDGNHIGNGYGVKESSNPDYVIEKYVFDCYSPDKTTSISQMRKTIKKKINEQTHNIVLNLTDSKFSPEDIMYSLYQQDIEGLDRIIIIKGDNFIQRIF